MAFLIGIVGQSYAHPVRKNELILLWPQKTNMGTVYVVTAWAINLTCGSAMRTKLFSVGIKDCKVETFTVRGHGGAGKDTSNTGVRITHAPSGSVGKCVDHRSQSKNKEVAFRRMAETREFQTWARMKAAELAGEPSTDNVVMEQMHPKNLKVEYKTESGWKIVPAGCCEHCGPMLTGRVRERDGTSWCDACWEAEGW